MYRRFGTCKKCKKHLEVYSRFERIAEIKFNIKLHKHYKKEHQMNMFYIIFKERIREIIDRLFRVS